MFTAGFLLGGIVTIMGMIVSWFIILWRQDTKEERKRKYKFQIMEHRGRRVKIVDFISASNVQVETNHFVYETVKFKDLKVIKAKTKIYQFENYKGARR